MRPTAVAFLESSTDIRFPFVRSEVLEAAEVHGAEVLVRDAAADPLVLLGAAFLVLSVRLQRRADRRSALRTYLYSLAYLALLFCAMVVDARVIG